MVSRVAGRRRYGRGRETHAQADGCFGAWGDDPGAGTYLPARMASAGLPCPYRRFLGAGQGRCAQGRKSGVILRAAEAGSMQDKLTCLPSQRAGAALHPWSDGSRGPGCASGPPISLQG